MWPLVNKPLSHRLRDWLATIWQPLKSVAKRYTVLWYVWLRAYCCSIGSGRCWLICTHLPTTLDKIVKLKSATQSINWDCLHSKWMCWLSSTEVQLSLCCTFSSKRLVQSRSLSYKLQATAAVCLSKTIASRGFYYPASSIDHLPTSQGLSNDW